MHIVLPILFGAVAVGLFAKKLTWRVWLAMCLWIVLVIARYYIKH